jgi:hypothetical protein
LFLPLILFKKSVALLLFYRTLLRLGNFSGFAVGTMFLLALFNVRFDNKLMRALKTLFIFGVIALFESFGVNSVAASGHWEMSWGKGYTLCEKEFKILQEDEKFRKPTEKNCIQLVLPQRIGLVEPKWDAELDPKTHQNVLFQLALYQSLSNEDYFKFLNNESHLSIKNRTYAKSFVSRFISLGDRIKIWRMPFPKELNKNTTTEAERKPLNVVGFFYFYNQDEFKQEQQRCSRYRIKKDQNFVVYLFNDKLTALDERLDYKKHDTIALALQMMNNKSLFFYKNKLYMFAGNNIHSLSINPEWNRIYGAPFCSIFYNDLSEN